MEEKEILGGRRRSLTVEDLLADGRTGLSLMAGSSGLAREIRNSHLQKPGLILAGHLEHLNPERIQVLGLTEISYLRRLNPEQLRAVAGRFLEQGPSAVVVTKNLEPPAPFLAAAEAETIPVLRTAERTTTFIKNFSAYLEKKLAPETTLHGVLMSIQGIGVLILGKSGIGKSECALDLVYKGHRLVADDLIFLRRLGPEVIVGQGSEMAGHHMEIRGLGIIDIKELFGVVSVADSARVELVIELVEWGEAAGQDRLGLEEEKIVIMDIHLPRIRIPVSPGRNLSVILEVAARNRLLRRRGHHAPTSLDEKLKEVLKAKAGPGGEGEAAP